LLRLLIAELAGGSLEAEATYWRIREIPDIEHYPAVSAIGMALENLDYDIALQHAEQLMRELD